MITSRWPGSIDTMVDNQPSGEYVIELLEQHYTDFCQVLASHYDGAILNYKINFLNSWWSGIYPTVQSKTCAVSKI